MPTVAIVMGSRSDLKNHVIPSKIYQVFTQVGIDYRGDIVSAHRNARPYDKSLDKHCSDCLAEGVKIFIGIAGMAAALPGTIAGLTERTVPVIGVGISSQALVGFDSLLSISQMPPGVPVAYTGLDKAGLINAAILACQMLAIGDEVAATGLKRYLDNSYIEPEYEVSLE